MALQVSETRIPEIDHKNASKLLDDIVSALKPKFPNVYLSHYDPDWGDDWGYRVMLKQSFFKRSEIAYVCFGSGSSYADIHITSPAVIEPIMKVAEKYADKFAHFSVSKPTANLAAA